MATTVVRHRVGWKYFIVDTERWLDSLAAQGLHISQIDFSANRFVFEQGEPEKCRHCFSFKKYPGDCAKREELLKKSGWQPICGDGRWALYKTLNISELNVLPNRRGIYLRNNSLLLLYNIISFVFLIAVFGGSFACFVMDGSQQYDQAFFNRAMTLIAVFALLILLNFLLFLRLSISNNKIIEDFGASINPEYALYRHFIRNFTFEKWLEKLLIKEGDILKAFRPILLTAPDRFEEWLEKNERRGLNYYKSGRMGFVQFFTRGAPRAVKFAIVNNRISDLDETRRFLEDDWKIMYYTPGQIGKFMLLAKTYARGGPAPQFFAGKRQYKANARIIAMKYVLAIVSIIVADALWFAADWLLLGQNITASVIAACILAFCAYLCARLVLYYLRVCARARRIYGSGG